MKWRIIKAGTAVSQRSGVYFLKDLLAPCGTDFLRGDAGINLYGVHCCCWSRCWRREDILRSRVLTIWSIIIEHDSVDQIIISITTSSRNWCGRRIYLSIDTAYICDVYRCNLAIRRMINQQKVQWRFDVRVLTIQTSSSCQLIGAMLIARFKKFVQFSLQSAYRCARFEANVDRHAEGHILWRATLNHRKLNRTLFTMKLNSSLLKR